jgi:hypothetical protein
MAFQIILTEYAQLFGNRGFTYFVLVYGPSLTRQQLDRAAATWEKITDS